MRPSRWPPSSPPCRGGSGAAAHCERALQASLERLDQPSVALYQIHWPLPLGTRAWLLDLARRSSRRLIGGGRSVQLRPERTAPGSSHPGRSRASPLATNQVEYSLLNRRPERNGLVDLCAELDVTIIAYSPLAQGLLTGKYGPAEPAARGPTASAGRRQLATLAPLIRRLNAIGENHGGRTPAQVALNWLVGRGAVPIPGAKTAEQARHNAGGVGWSLSDDEVSELSRLEG